MTPTIYREDLSRLHPGDTPERMLLVYEPLDDLITDDWLRPYCWGWKRVSFYPHWDHSLRHKAHETGHQLYFDDVVQSDGTPYRLISSSCVYRQGQWCMCWLAKRVEDPG